MSMSPFLTKHVPPATLAIDKWENADSAVNSTPKQENVAQGWTSKSLDITATSLDRASSRLRHQVDKESLYWNQILAISQEGWSITRATRGSHLLQVRFSLAEGERQMRSSRCKLMKRLKHLPNLQNVGLLSSGQIRKEISNLTML